MHKAAELLSSKPAAAGSSMEEPGGCRNCIAALNVLDAGLIRAKELSELEITLLQARERAAGQAP
jgi:hypothetical protein